MRHLLGQTAHTTPLIRHQTSDFIHNPAPRRLLLLLAGRPIAPCGPFLGGFAASCSAARGAPFLLMLGLVSAPLPVGASPSVPAPLPVDPLLRAMSLLVALLPLAPTLVGLRCGFCLGPWVPFRPSCECSCYYLWALRCLSPSRFFCCRAPCALLPGCCATSCSVRLRAP